MPLELGTISSVFLLRHKTPPGAIEAVGISETLAARLVALEKEKVEIEQSIEECANEAESNIESLPDVLPALISSWRKLVANIENIAANPNTELGDIEVARNHLHALIGDVRLESRDGVLWAHPVQNAKSPVETGPSGGLSINNQKMVAGA